MPYLLSYCRSFSSFALIQKRWGKIGAKAILIAGKCVPKIGNLVAWRKKIAALPVVTALGQYIYKKWRNDYRCAAFGMK
jgi:hypothetical protein